MAQGRPENIDPKIWEEAVRKARDLKTEMKEVDGVLDSIAQKVTGLGLDVWYDNIRKSSEQIRLEQEELNKIQAELVQTQTIFNQQLDDRLKKTTDFTELNKVLSAQGNDSNFILALQNSEYKGLLEKAGNLTDVKNFLNDLQSNQLDLTKQINTELGDTLLQNRGLSHELDAQRNALTSIVDKYAEAEAEAQKLEKRGFSFAKGLESYSKLFGKNAVDFIIEYDKVITQAQASTGVLLRDSEAGMMDLMGSVAAYGMSIQDATELIGVMGNELRTVSSDTLKEAVENFAPLQSAIGVTSEEISGVAGELMRWGQSSSEVRDYFEDIHKDSQMMGVNTRNVVRQITQNIGKMRQFGFTEGEDSLKRMATQAELLRIDVGEIFDVAEKARTLEGALDMAAELQLAGGSFSNINPMDLLSAARKGPEELGKILTSMGQDVGSFNEKGEYKFSPIDADRLQIVAKATGLKMETLQNSIMKTKEMAKKSDIFGNAFAGIDGVDQELANSQFAQMLKIGENGKVEISKEFEDTFKKFGIHSGNLANMDSSIAKRIYESRKTELDTLDERSKINQSLEQSMANFKQSIMSTLVIFEPVMKTLSQGLTWLSTTIGGFNETLKKAIGWSIAGVYGINKATKLLGKKSLFSRVASLGKGGGGGGESLAKKVGGAGGGGNAAGGGIGGGINSLAKGIKQASKHAMKIKMMGMAKLAGSLALLGGVIVGFGAAIAAIGGEASVAQMATAMGSMVIMVGALALVSKITKGVDMGGVLKGSIAMAILGAALIPFGYALGIMGELPLGNVLSALGIIALATLGIIGLGMLLMGPQILAVLIGVDTLIAIGVGLAIAGAGLMVAGMAFEKLTNINWGGMTQMAGALSVATPALIAFGLGALAFANPLTILGILAMTGNLALLAAVMIPLAQSLTIGAEGMERFASAIGELKSAVSDIDVSKLEQIQETASNMAEASRGSAMDKLASTVQGLLGGGDGGNGKNVMEHKIALEVYMDGKKMQSKILRDTSTMIGR